MSRFRARALITWSLLAALIPVQPGWARSIDRERAPASVRPIWSGTAKILRRPNTSFLNANSSSLALPSRLELRDELMTPEMASHLRADFEVGMKGYELREAHGLSTIEEQRAQVKWMQDFSKNVMSQVRSNQLRTKMRSVRRAAENDETISSLRTPIAVVATLVAIYNGDPLRFGLGGVGFNATSCLAEQRGSVQMNSSLVDASVTYVGRAPSSRNPFAPAPQDPVQRSERLHVGLSKGIQSLGMGAAITYGSTTRTMTTSLSRPVSDHVTAVWETNRVLSQLGRQKGAEAIFRLVYAFNF